ncbi:ATP-binding cassette domain-containing protein [Nocardia halotolerans]|uniref:ATP-binding cassette domain-containing protein n=1 Tax=Nocardia halotolerans TaxID=1755878 RepID=A0ABV8VHP9_9NOCA
MPKWGRVWWRWLVGVGVGVVVVVGVVGPLVVPGAGERAVGMPFAGPGGGAVLGTDRLGRDVLSLLLTGGAQLLVVAAVIAVAVTVLSAVLGAVAAVRPRAGAAIELGGDLVILLPAVLGILLVLTAWPQGGVAALIAVSLLFGVPYCARIFAAAAARIAATGYVEAAVASGESLPHLVFREILPNLRSIFTTQLGLRFVVAIYLVSTVSFLGVPALGADNWALMVRDNASGLLLNPGAVLAPSAAIAIVAVGVNLVVTTPTRRTRPAAGRTAALVDSAGVAGRVAGPDAVVDVGDPAVVEGLSVVADSGAVLLAPLSFRLKAGTVTALTGASGAGKSTAMRALLGDVPPGAGRVGDVLVAGQDVFALDAGALRTFRRERVAYVGQDPGSELNPLLRVRTLLAEAAPSTSDSERRAVLDLVGLDHTFLRRRCGRLSGGQQRRVALARAVLRRPSVLILDEPLAGLHGALRTEIARLIADLAVTESTAVLLSGHDTATVHAIADAVVEVHPPTIPATNGKPPTRTTPGAVLDQPRSETTAPETGFTLQAKGISVEVDDHRILADVDLDVGAGAALAVVGPSGAGKTTLARVIAGLHTATDGTLELRGTSIPVRRRRRIKAAPNGIQLVTQNPLAALNPHRTVGQTLARPLRRIARVPGPEVGARVESLLADVDLPADFATRHPGELSGGQRQRVALARALAAEPAVLICDEITTALDATTAAAIMSLLDRLRAEHGTALLMISHDMALVTRHCTELLVLDHGRVVETGSPEAVLAAPSHQATADLIG